MQLDREDPVPQRAAAGDLAARAEIYRRYHAAVAATARRVLRDPADADDAIQDAFVLVLRHLGQLADPSALPGWIAQIAARAALRTYRRRARARRRTIADPEAALDRASASGPPPDQLAELARLPRVLALPPAVRAVWLDRHVGGLRLDDIAARRGTSLATIKRRLADARAHIAAQLASAGDPTPRPRARRGQPSRARAADHGGAINFVTG